MRLVLVACLEFARSREVMRGDLRSDPDLGDLAHVVSEVFLAYADHSVRGEESLGERRVEAILETLLHGFIAKPRAAG